MVVFTFVICAAPYKFEALDTMLNLGQAILKKGHKIFGIFFYGSGLFELLVIDHCFPSISSSSGVG